MGNSSNDGYAVSCTVNSPIADHERHKVAIVVKDSTVFIYMEGTKVAEKAIGDRTTRTGDPVLLGTRVTGGIILTEKC